MSKNSEIAWYMVKKSWIDKDLRNHHANEDMMLSSIPVVGELLQAIKDTNVHGPETALDRSTYIQFHPAHLAAGPAAAATGAITAPLLAKSEAIRNAYEPINKWLLGKGPHRLAPRLGIGLANTIGLGLLGNYVARGLLSRQYTLKEAAFSNKTSDDDKKIRSYTGLAALLPSTVGNTAYALGAPIYREAGFWDRLTSSQQLDALRRRDADLAKNKIVMTGNRLEDMLTEMVTRNADGKVTKREPVIKHIKDPAQRIGQLIKMLHTTPGSYMDLDTPISKALAANLFDLKERRNIKGMIMGGKSDTPLLSILTGEPSFKRPALHVTAHEMGHAAQPSWMKSTWARAGLKAPLLSAAVPVLSDNEQAGVTASAIGTSAAIPGLIGEFDASKRGTGFLKNWLGKKQWKGLGRLGKLSPYVGIPTYLAAAATPWIGYGTKKYMGGYDKEPIQPKSFFESLFK